MPDDEGGTEYVARVSRDAMAGSSGRMTRMLRIIFVCGEPANQDKEVTLDSSLRRPRRRAS